MITKKELQICCQLSINAYQGRHGKVIELLEEKVEEIVEGVYLCTGWKDNNFYIIFEGTDGTNQWINNFDYKKETIPYYFPVSSYYKGHAGFLKHYEIIRKRVWHRYWENIREVIDGKSYVYITGHSLGAITATFCADDIETNGASNIKLITFGSPRGFSITSARNFNTRFNSKSNSYESWQVIVGNDIVTKVPTMFMGFKRVMHKIWIDKPTFKDFFKHPMNRIKGIWEDHYPQRYLKAINKLTGDYFQ